MSDNEATSGELSVQSARTAIKFVKKKHNLDALRKILDEHSAVALAFLIEVMNDEDVEMKIRSGCAKDIINFNIEVNDQISKDELSRAIAQLKAEEMINNNTPKIKELKEIEDTPSPMKKLDFSSIKAV